VRCVCVKRQRGEKAYISAAGLRFQAPEINLEHFRNLNAAADMYNLGLLIVWVRLLSLKQFIVCME
jgi:hypothetical protein